MDDHQSPQPTPWREQNERTPVFHYNRAEREALRGDRAGGETGGGFFRRNRSLAITLIDVVFVLILFVIFWFFLRPLADRVEIAGYRVTTEAFLFDGELLVTVRVVAPEDRSAPEASPAAAAPATSSPGAAAPGEPVPVAPDAGVRPLTAVPPFTTTVVSIALGDEQVEDLVPRSGEERVLRLRSPLSAARAAGVVDDEGRVGVTVTIAGETRVVSATVDGDEFSSIDRRR